MNLVYIVTVDRGFGPDVVGAFDAEPSQEWLEELEASHTRSALLGRAAVRCQSTAVEPLPRAAQSKGGAA